MEQRNNASRKRLRLNEILLLGGLAILLIFAIVEVFGNKEEAASVQCSAEEVRLQEILEMMDGVGAAQVMIAQGENGNKSVVIVCEGANDFSVLIDVREAAAAAVGIDEKNVKIYLKNKQ